LETPTETKGQTSTGTRHLNNGNSEKMKKEDVKKE
jgi:hypothetical protein